MALQLVSGVKWGDNSSAGGDKAVLTDVYHEYRQAYTALAPLYRRWHGAR